MKNKKNEVRRHTIKNWSEYLDKINRLDYKRDKNNLSVSGGTIFRGQSKPEWKLSSKLERRLVIKNKKGVFDIKKNNGQDWYDEKCNELVNRFRNYCNQISDDFKNKNDKELFSIGRHYGLLTPFLDWTFNPFVATFFAFLELYKNLEFNHNIKSFFKDGYVTVWRLNIWPELIANEENFEIITLNSKLGERLNAQDGAYTYLKTVQHSDLESYLKSQNLLNCLERYDIPYEIVEEGLIYLDNMGFNIFSLFPDLEGAAGQSNIEIKTLHNTFLMRSVFKSK